MKNIHWIFLFLLSTQYIFAQTTIENIISPIKLDRETLSGVGLEKIDIKAEPEKDFYQKNLFRGDVLSVYVVSTASWTNKMDNFPFDEFVYMYHGQAKITPLDGPIQTFYTGDYFFAPKGFTGDWEIIAGENLHYEFSVISSKRAEKALDKVDNHHQLFDKELISGVDIRLDSEGRFSSLLQKGAELTIHLNAESPDTRSIASPSKEAVIHILSGQLKLTDQNQVEQIFHSGDFLVLPKGFTGDWTSDGHGLMKYLIIEGS